LFKNVRALLGFMPTENKANLKKKYRDQAQSYVLALRRKKMFKSGKKVAKRL
jgi:hypothetical protein